ELFVMILRHIDKKLECVKVIERKINCLYCLICYMTEQDRWTKCPYCSGQDTQCYYRLKSDSTDVNDSK
ncbi:MAG: hypothetical protein ACM3JQ_02735, partial [Candidatus Eiseniibacteriota bacterium]